MKKLLTLALIGALTFVPVKERENGDLESKLDERKVMVNFDLDERNEIKLALDLVRERYELPRILFYKSPKVLDIVMGTGSECPADTFSFISARYFGNVEEDSVVLPEIFPKRLYGGYDLIVLRDEEYYNKVSLEADYVSGKPVVYNRRWNVPNDEDPMAGIVLHEIGHAYYNKLSFNDRIYLISEFSEVDLRIPEKFRGTLIGHASFYSYFNMLNEYVLMNEDFNTIDDLASEQFAETFVYHILGHNYMDDDPGFMKKLKSLEEVMEKFKK